MSSPIKPNNFSEIFGKPEAEIDESIAKGYLLRREVTEVLDNVKKRQNLTCESDGNGGLKWKIGNTVIDPTHKTHKTPFWMRRVSHWLKLTFSTKYKEKFEDKIAKVHEAYDAFKDSQVSAQQQVDDAQKELDDQRALDDQQAIDDQKALDDAQAQQQLQDDITNKEAEITPAQAKLDQLNQELATLNTELQDLDSEINRADAAIADIDDNHTDLTTLDTRLNSYLLKGAYLEEEDKPEVERLENLLYGQGQSTYQFRNPDNRKAQLQNLANKKLQQEQLKTNAENDKITCSAAIDQKTIERDLKLTELTTLQDDLQALKDQIPSSDPDPTVDAVVDDAVVDDVDDDIEPEAKPKLGIKALLAGKVDIDRDKINETQDIKNNPLISKKALFIKIANRADDDFYEKTFVPGLRLVTSLLAPNQQDADAMFNKWKTGLESCVDKWNSTDSKDHDIDNLIPLDTLFENIMQANDALDFLAKSKLNATEFFHNLSTLKIPDSMTLTFAVSDVEAEQILDAYLEDPEGTDLSSLFAPNTEFQTWPKDCQFFLAVSILAVRLENSNSANDADFRQRAMAVNAEARSIIEPPWVGIVLGLAKSKLFFEIGIKNAAGLIPAIQPEAIRLTETQTALRTVAPNGQLTPELDAKFQAAFTFAKNPARMAFDKEYTSFATSLITDVVKAVAAKHKDGREINLYNVVNNLRHIRNTRIDILEKEKEYFDALETGARATKAKKRTALEKAQGQQVINSLNLVKTLSSFAVNNPTMVKVTEKLDDTIMTTMRDQGPINLETEEFIPWFQTTVLEPLNSVV